MVKVLMSLLIEVIKNQNKYCTLQNSVDKWTRKLRMKKNGESFNVFINRRYKTKRRIKISIAL